MERQGRARQDIQSEIQEKKGGFWEMSSSHPSNNMPADG